MSSPKEMAKQARVVSEELIIFARMLEGLTVESGATVPNKTTETIHTTQEKPVVDTIESIESVEPVEIIEPDRIAIKANTIFNCTYCTKPVLVASRDVYLKSTDSNKGMTLDAFVGGPDVAWPPTGKVNVNRQGGISINCPACNAESGVMLYKSPM